MNFVGGTGLVLDWRDGATKVESCKDCKRPTYGRASCTTEKSCAANLPLCQGCAFNRMTKAIAGGEDQ